jgi:hypothetical protein
VRCVSWHKRDFLGYLCHPLLLPIPADDCSHGPLTFPGNPFRFFGVSRSTLYISNNGLVSFDGPVSTYTALPFPINGSFAVIAPFWADVDTRAAVTAIPGFPTPNRIYYRMPAVPLGTDVVRMSNEVANSFPTELPFTPTVVAVFTWFAVGRYASRSDYLNTFQAVLASDPRELKNEVGSVSVIDSVCCLRIGRRLATPFWRRLVLFILQKATAPS